MTQLLSSQIQELKSIAKNAGEIIMEIYHRPYEVFHKNDTSPVTEADLAADKYIRRALNYSFPKIPILSEESSSDFPRGAETFFLVDPLDGTKEFITRNDEFTVNIALIKNGLPIASVVFAPAIDELFFATNAGGAWKEKNAIANQIHVKKIDSLDLLRLISSRSHQSREVEEFLQGFDSPFSLIEVGSSLKFCKIAEGLADIYPRFGPTSQWDTAAGQFILESSGGVVLETNGDILSYGLEKPILNNYFVALGDPTLKDFVFKKITN